MPSTTYRANPNDVRRDLSEYLNATALSKTPGVHRSTVQEAATAAYDARCRLGAALGKDALERLIAAATDAGPIGSELAVREACRNAVPDPGFRLADSVCGMLFDLMIRGEEEWSERRTTASFNALRRVEEFARGYCRAACEHAVGLEPVDALRTTVRSYERFYGTHLPLCVPLP